MNKWEKTITTLKTEKKASKKANNKVEPASVSIDLATQKMIARAQDCNIETVFARAANMKCNIGIQGVCCKNCSMGLCCLPISKSDIPGIVGEDDRKGLCGATPNTIAARNFIIVLLARKLKTTK